VGTQISSIPNIILAAILLRTQASIDVCVLSLIDDFFTKHVVFGRLPVASTGDSSHCGGFHGDYRPLILADMLGNQWISRGL
jgi:hypothetical protein